MDGTRRIEFGRRRVAPRVAIVDAKLYVRTFLAETFEELGFIPSGFARAAELAPALNALPPDLVLIVVTGEAGVEDVLGVLAAGLFPGKVILLGAHSLPALAAMQRLGSELGLAMLPVLTTPFRTTDLTERLAGLLPAAAPPAITVDLVDALANDWIELHYQPKIDPRSLVLCGAEAVIRLRHPTWGIVAPDRFAPADGDPHFTALSDLVLTRAMADWRYFAADKMPVEVSIALPAAVLGDPGLLERVRRRLPDDPAFGRILVAIDGTEIAGDLADARETARRLARQNIGLSIGSAGGDWSSLLRLEGFPFAEIKVDRALVHGSAGDRLKRAGCATIIDLCRRLGVRALAGGVETRADFLAMREAGFDLVQGQLFGKPLKARKFARTLHLPTLPLPP